MATMDEKRYMGDVASLGCVVCRNSGLGATPAEVHHKRSHAGTALRASHYDTIPLCTWHHRTGTDSIHRSPLAFVRLYGTEDDLITQTRREVKAKREAHVQEPETGTAANIRNTGVDTHTDEPAR